MTVCIGLVCDSGNRILLSADTRGSYGIVTSNEQMGKLFDLPGNFCGAISGIGSECTDVVAELHYRMGTIPQDELAPERVRKCIVDSYGTIYRTLIDEALRNGLRITLDDYHHDPRLAPRIRRKADEILKDVCVDVSLIVAGFYRASPVQFVVDGGLSVTVRPEITPGNAVIGSGMNAALSWLNYRKQNIHFGLAHSLLHLTEAKQFAETDQFVGQFRGVMLLSPNSCKPLNWNREAQALVQGWWKKYGLPLSDALEEKSHRDALWHIIDPA